MHKAAESVDTIWIRRLSHEMACWPTYRLQPELEHLKAKQSVQGVTRREWRRLGAIEFLLHQRRVAAHIANGSMAR